MLQELNKRQHKYVSKLQQQEQLISKLQNGDGSISMNYETFKKIWYSYQQCLNVKINILNSILQTIRIQQEIRMNSIKTGNIITNMDILSYEPNISLNKINNLQILQILDTTKNYKNDVMIRTIQSIMDPLQYYYVNTSVPADLCMNYFHNNSIAPITTIQQKKFCGFIVLAMKTNEQMTSKQKTINQLTNYITTNCGLCDNDFQKITQSVKFLNYCLELIDDSTDFDNLMTLIVEYCTYLRRSKSNNFTSSQQIVVFDKYNNIQQKQPCNVEINMDVYPQFPCLMMERIYYLWEHNIQCESYHTSIVLAYSICSTYCEQKYKEKIWKDGFRGYYLSSKNTQEKHAKFSTAFHNVMMQHLHLFQEIGWWNKSNELGAWDFLTNLLMVGSIKMITNMTRFLMQIEDGVLVTNGSCDQDDSCFEGVYPKIIKGYCQHEIMNQVKAQQMFRKQQNISIHRQSIKNMIEKICILAQLQCQMDETDHCYDLFYEFIGKKINLSEFESNLTERCCFFLLFRLIYEEKEYQEMYRKTLGFLHLDMPQNNITNILTDASDYKKHNNFIKEAQQFHGVQEIKKHFQRFINDKSFGDRKCDFNPVILIYIMDCISKNSILMTANVGIQFQDKEQNWYTNFLPFHKHCTQSFKQKNSKKMIDSKCKLNLNSTVIQDCIKSFQIKMRNIAQFIIPLLDSPPPCDEDTMLKYWNEFTNQIAQNNYLKITTHTQQAHCVEQTFHIFNKEKNKMGVTLKQKQFQNKQIIFFVSNRLLEKSKCILQKSIQNNDIFKIISVDIIDFIDNKKWNAFDLIQKSGNEEYAGLILLYPICLKKNNECDFANLKFGEYEDWGQSVISKLQQCTRKNYNIEISMRLQLPAEFSDNEEDNVGYFIVIVEEKHRNNQLKCLLFQPHLHEMLSAPNVVASLNALYLFYGHPNFFGWNKNSFAYNDYSIVDINKKMMRVLLIINIFQTHTKTESWYVFIFLFFYFFY